jgi:hypothetical protein
LKVAFHNETPVNKRVEYAFAAGKERTNAENKTVNTAETFRSHGS